jgi:hypothetical protein
MFQILLLKIEGNECARFTASPLTLKREGLARPKRLSNEEKIRFLQMIKALQKQRGEGLDRKEITSR